MIIGIDEATEYLDKYLVVNPFSLIESAVRKGFITIDEINKNIWDSAVSESESIEETYRDSGEGIGSSDMNAFISSMLNDAGIKVGVKDNTYQRMADGGGIPEGYHMMPDGTIMPDSAHMSKGGKTKKKGKVKFADKVASIKKSLLERKKVPKAVQKDYGKTFSPAEAEDSAKRIVGSQTYAERIKYLTRKRKK